MIPDVITGWDIGDGGGSNRTHWLPVDPKSMVIAPALLNFVLGEGAKAATFEIWGLDPRLTLAVAFGRAPNPSLPLTGAIANVTTPAGSVIGVDVYGKFAGRILPVCSLDPALLFQNGGTMSPGDGDGCEIVTAAEALRFWVPLQRNGNNSYDVVVNLIVRPNQPLGCRELAIALAAQLTVVKTSTIVWDGAP